MAVATRKSAASVAARQRARDLRVRFLEREQKLLEAAEEFLAGRESTGKAVEGIGRQIVRVEVEWERQLVRVREERARQIEGLEGERVREEREGWERGARVAARMRGLGVKEGEVAERLGVELGEVRRMVAWVKGQGAKRVPGAVPGGEAGPGGGARGVVPASVTSVAAAGVPGAGAGGAWAGARPGADGAGA
ncbi:hypothetical protein ABTY61_22705 [Kitasatospora sp. NPDC096128]|uniref:hypothetical protein n=1 Tax=Kitasatospora sp. NPDC096128 TaxID=3155547 RepID=UPI003320021A